MQNGSTTHQDDEILLSLWQAAAAAPFGIAMRSPDIEHLRRKMFYYRIDLRKQSPSGTSPFDHLSFRSDPKNLFEIYLVQEAQLGKKSPS
jgi:hypothetical protein